MGSRLYYFGCAGGCFGGVMSKAVLEMEAPVSCRVCPLNNREMPATQCSMSPIRYIDRLFTSQYNNTRHPRCPLKIIEDGLRWKLTVLKDGCVPVVSTCPNCISTVTGGIYNYCPSCGVKLLPPEANNE